MSRPATSRLKVNPVRGRMPTLQFCRPAELHIDPAYQRDIAGSQSQTLIRKIAMFWNWDLCQPLIVARRQRPLDGEDLAEQLYVVDGQHRLAAARQRGDIDQLPCVITSYPSAADEAASFVHLNQQRRPLGKLDVFKAAVASEDGEAMAIMAALREAGLSLAPHTNLSAWKPGQLINIGGIEASWRTHGAAVTQTALRALAEGLAGQVMRYAGTLFPGIAAVCADEMAQDGAFAGDRFAILSQMIGGGAQEEWRRDVALLRAVDQNLKFSAASAAVFRKAWAELLGETADMPAPVPAAPAAKPSPAQHPGTPQRPGLIFKGDKAWCNQCEMMVSRAGAEGCKSRFCKLKVAP